MKRMVLGLCIASMVMSSMVFATPLDKTKVMKEATWAVHVDVDQFRQSVLGKEMINELTARGVMGKLDNFAKVFSFHPINDIQCVTLFGQDKDPQKAAAIIRGTCNPATLIAMVGMNPYYEKSEYGTYTIHSWIDDKKGPDGPRQYGCFYNPTTLLMGMGKETLQQSLDVLDGKHANAAGNAMFNQFAEGSHGVMVSLFAEKTGETVNGIQEAAILQQTNRIALMFGEKNNASYVDILLQARNAAEATKIQQFVQGMLAMASLSVADKNPKLDQLISAVNSTCTDDVVRVQCNWDSKDLIALIKQLEQANNIKITQ
ncbi:MAG TPA: hypothetical protein PKB02_18935 [Anaerohalosphaeraceae bacterium]|nr:hypothetical protein [Anaerohalosphaeraceae bacterium]